MSDSRGDCCARPHCNRMPRSFAAAETPALASANEHRHSQRTTVVLGRLDSVLALGAATLLRDDPRLQVIDCGPADRALEDALAGWEPEVAVVGETVDAKMVEHLRAIRPQTMMLVLAHDPNHDAGIRLLAAGANCVARCVPELDLGAMVHRTAQGRRFFATADGSWIERRYPSRAEPLTEREREVLVHLTKGASYSEIACALGISYRTVQTYVPRIIAKLGVHHRRELLGMPVPGECVTE
jgi:DNA-binding NarL/FixJ family response regulator